jgi:hypothetical protein
VSEAPLTIFRRSQNKLVVWIWALRVAKIDSPLPQLYNNGFL